MKRLHTLSLAALCSISMHAQDIIIKKNGEEIKSKVTEINETVIKYKKWDNINGPVYSLSLVEVFKINYENGQSDLFGNKPTDRGTIATTEPKIETGKFQKSQEVLNGYPELPLKNVPFLYDSKTNGLTELESASFTKQRQHKGIWGNVTVIAIPGVSSNVRVRQKNIPLKFLIYLSDVKANPFSICELNPCEINAQREFISLKEGFRGTIKQEGVSIKFEQLNDQGLYLISLPSYLPPAEYFFYLTQYDKVYAFGFDK